MRNDATPPSAQDRTSERELRSLVDLVARLRAPDGCPWDQRQTHASLKGPLIEEAYETVAAIEADDSDALAEELGDLLLHVAFHIQIAREADAFDANDVIEGIVDKIVRRHPHVFGEVEHDDEAAVNAQWERLKSREKPANDRSDVNATLPALVAARKRLDKRAHLGQTFESPDDNGLAQRVQDELDAPDGDSRLGTLLLTIIEAARQRDLEPELCLRQALNRMDANAEDRT